MSNSNRMLAIAILKKARSKQGLTQKDMSTSHGMNHNQVGRFETGQVDITFKKLGDICDDAGLRIEDVITEIRKHEK